MSENKGTRFAEILCRLRKERGCSQKKAAGDLGISQALLSHYEKGIRECGLDFVVKCSEYYGVTTDYLLGVSTSRYGMDENYFSKYSADDDGAALANLTQATKMMIDTAVASASDITKYLNDYYTLCVYRGALTLAKAGVLPTEMFRLDNTFGHELASAAIAVLDARFAFIEDKSRTGTEDMNQTSLHLIIEQAEEYIVSNFISD